MSVRTQTRPNGVPGVRETVWGWDAIGAVFAILSAIIGSTWYVSAQLAYVESEVRATRAVAVDARDTADAVRADLAEKYAVAQGVHASFLTKDEFYQYMAPEVRTPKKGRTP